MIIFLGSEYAQPERKNNHNHIWYFFLEIFLDKRLLIDTDAHTKIGCYKSLPVSVAKISFGFDFKNETKSYV